MTRASAIGPTGVAVGVTINIETQVTRAVAWNAAGTSVSVLPGLPGQSTPQAYAEANGIDDPLRLTRGSELTIPRLDS